MLVAAFVSSKSLVRTSTARVFFPGTGSSSAKAALRSLSMLFPDAAIPAKPANVVNSSLRSQSLLRPSVQKRRTARRALSGLESGLALRAVEPTPHAPESSRLDAHLSQKLRDERRDLIEVCEVAPLAAGDVRDLPAPDHTLKSVRRLLRPDFDNERLRIGLIDTHTVSIWQVGSAGGARATPWAIP